MPFYFRKECPLNSGYLTAFALVLTVFLVSGEPVDIAVSVHRTMQECVTAATEQKIPGNCYPVDKVIHQDNNEIPAGL
ncbi:DUF1482 family protein [Escherichia coli]|nr:DUF1482 family protein [Escherichia coli]